MELKIAWLYPDLMSTYGDRGNIISLKYRCLQRQINPEIIRITLETDPSVLKSCDLIFMGGAQDRQQKIAADDLFYHKGPVLKSLIEEGIPGLFICGAYQFLGNYYQPAEGNKIKGLGIFDLYTRHFGNDKPRCIGNIAVSVIGLPKMDGLKLVGFENHGGRTYLENGLKPFARTIFGSGNNGEDKTEGAVYKNAFGTYLHGPILPKNPEFTDYLLATALCKKYRKEIKLIPLNNDLENQARQNIFQRILKNGR